MSIPTLINRWFISPLAALATLCYGPTIYAVPWQFTPSVLVSGNYTDNVDLEPDGEKDSELVTEIAPALSVVRDGRRFRADLDYVMQNLIYLKDSNRNGTFHQLIGEATTEILRETLFVDANTSFSQQIINPTGRLSDSNINQTDNTTDTLTASISPNFQRALNPFVEAVLNYEYGIVHFLDKDNPNNIEGNIEDSEEHLVEAELNGLRPIKRVSWRFRATWNQIDFKNFRIDTFRAAGIQLGYQLNRNLAVLAVGGYEDNDFEREGSAPRGEFWAVGIRWEPTPRDLLEARFGSRFFGDTKSFEWIHEGRKITTELSFREDITTGNQELISEDFLPGQGINPVTPRFRSEVFINRVFEAAATVDLPKSSLSVNAFYGERKFQSTGEQDDNIGVTAMWDWQLSPRTSLSLDLLYTNNKFGGDDTANNQFGRAQIELEHFLGPRTRSFLKVVHRRQDSDDPFDEFSENGITIGIERSF